MAREITQHGIRWILDSCSNIYCPECNSGNVNWLISYSQPKYCSTKTWIAECECKTCSCQWKVMREETIREEC
jgi:hypothetical protein